MSESLDRPQRAILDGKVPCLSVVLPVFNEEATVEKIVHAVLAQPLVAELVAVDDGSYSGRTYAQGKKVDWRGRLHRAPLHLKI